MKYPTSKLRACSRAQGATEVGGGVHSLLYDLNPAFGQHPSFTLAFLFLTTTSPRDYSSYKHSYPSTGVGEGGCYSYQFKEHNGPFLFVGFQRS